MLTVECYSRTRTYLPSSGFEIVDPEDIQRLDPQQLLTEVSPPDLQLPDRYHPGDCRQTREVQSSLPQWCCLVP